MPPNSEKELTPIRLREATLAGDAWPQSRLTKQEDRRAEFFDLSQVRLETYSHSLGKDRTIWGRQSRLRMVL